MLQESQNTNSQKPYPKNPKKLLEVVVVLLMALLVVFLYIAFAKPKEITLPTQDSYEPIISDLIDSQNPVGQTSATYLYKNHGFTMELPGGYIPPEITGETGPTISIQLPNNGFLVYITNATWWEKYNLVGQADFVREQKIGNHVFKVYKFIGQDAEFYFFRQGNIAFTFNDNIINYMETFKFVGWN